MRLFFNDGRYCANLIMSSKLTILLSLNSSEALGVILFLFFAHSVRNI
jgi:hypothetical protein